MKKNILIIDDDEEMCEEISEILTENGYNTEIVHDGLIGLNKITENEYNLVLLDLKIPSLNGFKVLKKVRENNKKIKIIVLTARPNFKISNDNFPANKNLNEEEKILKKADCIINKPFDILNLINKINELIKKSSF